VLHYHQLLQMPGSIASGREGGPISVDDLIVRGILLLVVWSIIYHFIFTNSGNISVPGVLLQVDTLVKEWLVVLIFRPIRIALGIEVRFIINVRILRHGTALLGLRVVLELPGLQAVMLRCLFIHGNPIRPVNENVRELVLEIFIRNGCTD
jgi:hypothetical protein